MSESHQLVETKVPGGPHPYHMVNPKCVAITGSISALVTALGAVQYFHWQHADHHDHRPVGRAGHDVRVGGATC